ncbi:MAG: YSC84-related protein [Chromatiales bacterium]|jgi:lipid-binding SYLF domain-containing protein|nr:YSC84-related protein [Chromatiales bacterium]MDX9766629.1 YSC84-related protein [Ectothiorhodospiraceae bacterium]
MSKQTRFIMHTQALVLLLMLAFALPQALAASAAEIDAKVDQTLEEFYRHTSAGKNLAAKAQGVLVFPEIVKAGFGVGGEYGEGALRVKGKTADYYSIASASIGLQFGAQLRSVVILFMTKDAYDGFRNTDGWKAGVDASVAVATLGAGGEISSETIKEPVIGFVFSNKGLMYNLTIEGSKITKLSR